MKRLRGQVLIATAKKIDQLARYKSHRLNLLGDHQGKLIIDLTVTNQAIKYPTDLGLLNEAREFSE